MSLIEDALRKVQDPITQQQPPPASPQKTLQKPTTEPPAVHSWSTAPASPPISTSSRSPLNALVVVVFAVSALTVALAIWGSIWIGRMLSSTVTTAHHRENISPPSSATTNSQEVTPVVPPAAERAQQTPFVLSGIVEGLGEPYAMINGKTVGVGEQIAGATVIEVGHGSVKLRQANGSELTLHVSR